MTKKIDIPCEALLMAAPAGPHSGNTYSVQRVRHQGTPTKPAAAKQTEPTTAFSEAEVKTLKETASRLRAALARRLAAIARRPAGLGPNLERVAAGMKLR